MIKFIAAILKIAVMLALAGHLKTMILVMAGNAATAQKNMISYSKFTRALTTGPRLKKKSVQNHGVCEFLVLCRLIK